MHIYKKARTGQNRGSRAAFMIVATMICLASAGCKEAPSLQNQPSEESETTEENSQFATENSQTATGNTKLLTEEDKWLYLDRDSLNGDTYSPSADSSSMGSKFVHYEVGGSHEGVAYYLEYIDNDDFYITFDNSGNDYGRCIELFIYDKTFPNEKDEEWHLDRAVYYIDAGETVTKQYGINGRIIEDRPIQFGISIDDRGFNYYQDKANILEKSKPYNLDITYYGVDNTAVYYDIDQNPVNDTLPDGFNNMTF